MARDAKGRFLPGFKVGEEPHDGRHFLSRRDRRKGYEQAALTKRLPSRLRAWLRSKIRNHYISQKGD